MLGREEGVEVLPLGYEYWPQALGATLRRAWDVTDGIDVLGYTYWSLLDNFEWTFGYGPHFGFVEVDGAAPFARRPKPSTEWFAGVVAANALDVD
jgi:beta-glucosidase